MGCEAEGEPAWLLSGCHIGWIHQRGEGERGERNFENEELWDMGFVTCKLSIVKVVCVRREARGVSVDE